MDIINLLKPITVEDFAHKWNKQSCVFLGRRDRFTDLAFDRSELKMALRAGRLAVKAQYMDPTAGHTELAIDPGQVDDQFAQGRTICVQNIDKVLPALARQTSALRRSMQFAGPVNFSCYWSPESGGFDLHCDDHPVFILQIEGMKKWRYCATPAVDRTFGSIVYSEQRLRDLRAIGLDIRDPDHLESVTLTPGDMLYLPAGTWHQTCAVGGQSLGLTLRCFEGSAFDLVQSMLDRHMTDHRWHEMLPLVGGQGPDPLSIPPDVAALLAARLGELKDFVAGLTVMDLAQVWAEQFAHRGTRSPAPIAVTAGDQLLVSRNAVVLRSDGGDPSGTYWVHNGTAECKLSLADPRWFENVMRTGSFTAGQSCHWGSEPLSWEMTRSWLEELIYAGLVGFA
jgi:ribosomal protein L16 Arg81 hydroxylase